MAKRGRSRGLFMGKAFGKRGHFAKVAKTKDEKTSSADNSALNGVTLVSDYASLPTSGIQDGTLYRTSDENKIWLSMSNIWYLASTLANTAPVISGVNDAISITSTTATTVITATAVDSEYMPLTWSYTTSGLGGLATVSHTDGTFTITTGSEPSNGTFTLNIIVTDGKFTTTASTSVTMVNAGPTPITGISSSYTLNSRGGANTVLTANSADPDGASLTWSYTIASGSLNGTTIAQADNVFTINPHDSQDATFVLTISASDGVDAATKAVSFSLAHMPDVDILVVGGGGGGSAYGGAGGGAGEYKIWSGTPVYNREYIASVGSGGADPSLWNYPAGAGTRSQFYFGTTWRIRAGGGGGGSTTYKSADISTAYYAGGGSTGGGSRSSGSSPNNNTPVTATDIYNSSTDVGTGYRYRGGNGGGDHGGAGGGASEVGANQNSNWSGGGYGGDGKTWLDGNAYAGGGGAGVDYAQYNNVSQGGSGGGGNGAEYYSHNGDHGTGGGGGGARNNTHSVQRDEHDHDSHQAGTFGGNGIIIIRVLSTDWQPTVTGSYWTTTTSGGYTYYKCVRLGTYNGSGRVDGASYHNATSLAFEAARGTVTGTLKWEI